MKSLARLLFPAAAALLLASCASAPPDPRPAPHYIELLDEPAISTFHFPPGLYSLGDTDQSGFYYTAPQPVVKHGFPGSIPYQGGIFMRRDNHRRLRGYVIWAGGRTKIGDVSNARYEFRD